MVAIHEAMRLNQKAVESSRDYKSCRLHALVAVAPSGIIFPQPSRILEVWDDRFREFYRERTVYPTEDHVRFVAQLVDEVTNGVFPNLEQRRIVGFLIDNKPLSDLGAFADAGIPTLIDFLSLSQEGHTIACLGTVRKLEGQLDGVDLLGPTPNPDDVVFHSAYPAFKDGLTFYFPGDTAGAVLREFVMGAFEKDPNQFEISATLLPEQNKYPTNEDLYKLIDQH